MKEDCLMEKLAGGGFRDISGIGSSNGEMWKDMSLNNENDILCLVKEIKEE
ncbi:prephenate dehydrogenase dimerization domain-containing protein, partial [Staphylococcus epidermidis]|uniref:prephenate dehydrogenase dimerization domain-containing protein n=1 Tax=Staphylococcus epidermidis TaxID=1282 RepID=UPI0037DA0D6C